ncbi:ATP-binding protein [Burkholderia ambifaria]|uniref:Transcriptional regulator, winged helix family n=1 Tax=Burkholderia ambifaria MEX-5 TaxID=396597 RepID=B1T3K8_9BURK|nr:winged helix-turn-helix domain-containing protein [Burkholderia ambifaria]EDT41831.1 transcriptional regulator, winged helix family [Burkholderia ambifaria MEX-5]
MTVPSDLPEVFSFGQTVVVRSRRELTHAGTRVEIGGRAFDLLIALVEARGVPVSRDTLQANVWAGRVIEGNTVEARISVIRRALGDDRDAIATIEGFGYQFVAEITPVDANFFGLAQPSLHRAASGKCSVPPPASKLIGRARELAAATAIVESHRIVTFVGPGGVGKTKLAFEVARNLTSKYAGGVLYSDLGSISEATTQLFEGIERDFRSNPQLLILDSCEHLIDSVAHAIEHFLNVAPSLTIIATSRETLRINGEYVFRVSPCEVPTRQNLSDVRALGSIQILEHFISSGIKEADLPVAIEICRRLDGIPLALELASACVPALGLRGVAGQLDDRFTLLTRGTRTAVPRHRTLLANLDWSYELLDEKQKVVLERLSLFAGQFTLDAAQHIAADGAITALDVLTRILDLEKKSLIGVRICDTRRVFELLESVRMYAQLKLRDRGDYPVLARLHARYVLAALAETVPEIAVLPSSGSPDGGTSVLDDLRAAVNWGLAPDGDIAIAVDLVLAGTAVMMRASMTDECLEQIERALKAIATRPDSHDLVQKLSRARETCLAQQATAHSRTHRLV